MNTITVRLRIPGEGLSMKTLPLNSTIADALEGYDLSAGRVRLNDEEMTDFSFRLAHEDTVEYLAAAKGGR